MQGAGELESGGYGGGTRDAANPLHRNGHIERQRVHVAVRAGNIDEPGWGRSYHAAGEGSRLERGTRLGNCDLHLVADVWFALGFLTGRGRIDERQLPMSVGVIYRDGVGAAQAVRAAAEAHGDVYRTQS